MLAIGNIEENSSQEGKLLASTETETTKLLEYGKRRNHLRIRYLDLVIWLTPVSMSEKYPDFNFREALAVLPALVEKCLNSSPKDDGNQYDVKRI